MGCLPNTPKKLNSTTEGNSNSVVIRSSLFLKEEKIHPTERYYIINAIGKGGYGKVYKVMNRENGIIRAMKSIPLDKIRLISNSSKIFSRKKFNPEVEILKNLDHPNIIKIYEIYVTSTSFHIISEYCPGGDLFDKLEYHNYFSEKQVAYLMRQILSSVSYLHDNNVIHRDIKLENILVASQTDDNFMDIKMIDFGSSLFKTNTLLKDSVGSVNYIAPEVILGKYNEKCDLWSCGVLMYTLLSGEMPFYGIDKRAVLQNVVAGKYNFISPNWKKVSSSAKNLIKALLNKDIDKRLSAKQALNHEWFNEVYDRKEVKKPSENIIKNFFSNSKSKEFQKMVVTYIVHYLLPEDDEIRNTFIALDKDGDGKLTKADLLSARKSIEDSTMVTQNIDDFMSETDDDNDGFITYEEFLKASFDKSKILTEKNLKKAFQIFAKSGKNKICVKNLKNVFGNKKMDNEKLWKGMISEFDFDGDGEISYNEFMTMMDIKNYNSITCQS